MVAAAFTLTVNLKAFVAFNAMEIIITVPAELAIGAYVFAIVANAAVLAINFVEIAETAIGAGFTVGFVAFYAYFPAILAYLNAIFAKVTFGADIYAILAGVTAFTMVNIVVEIAF